MARRLVIGLEGSRIRKAGEHVALGEHAQLGDHGSIMRCEPADEPADRDVRHPARDRARRQELVRRHLRVDHHPCDVEAGRQAPYRRTKSSATRHRGEGDRQVVEVPDP